MMKKSEITISSNRSFGILFFVVFLIVALWPLINNETIRLWSIIVSFVFLILGLAKSKMLTPLNILWFKLGVLLGKIFAPLAMGIVFFAVVTPIGIIMRLLNKDILKKKYNKNLNSYWIDKDNSQSSMRNQF